MSAEKLAQGIMSNIVNENLSIYSDIFANSDRKSISDAHWKSALKFYSEITDTQKEVLISIIRQTIIDTVSNVFGVIDGVSEIEGFDDYFQLVYSGDEIQGPLQDEFLAEEKRTSD